MSASRRTSPEADVTDGVRGVIIVGSGPAGYTAALDAARADLRPLRNASAPS